MVAAIPIANSMKAPQLLDYHMKIINGLLDHDICVISYACDGTETERAMQRLFIARADRSETVIIRHPHGGCRDLEVVISFYRGHPIAVMQDNKHFGKTGRNNLYSNAHLPVLGNFVAGYKDIRDAAMMKDSNLYMRDVEKVDRQDDNSALRLYSADTLSFLVTNFPEKKGTIAYLFIFGELVDAYQNRVISHHERVKMVLRARFFVDIWRQFLKEAGYNAKYCISREALDILTFIVNGFLQLLIIYRDHLPGSWPMIPWLHSSEPCEHMFGEMRKIVKDFTVEDFLRMITKLRVKIRETCLHSEVSNAKQRAAGYAHTYFDAAGSNFAKLSHFPGNEELNELSVPALEEAESIWEMLGVSASLLRSLGEENHVLPSAKSLLHGFSANNAASDEDESDDDNTEDSEDSPVANELQRLITLEETVFTHRDDSDDQRLAQLRNAAIALSIDDSIRM